VTLYIIKTPEGYITLEGAITPFMEKAMVFISVDHAVNYLQDGDQLLAVEMVWKA